LFLVTATGCTGAPVANLHAAQVRDGTARQIGEECVLDLAVAQQKKPRRV
jgi:hypothetical protein